MSLGCMCRGLICRRRNKRAALLADSGGARRSDRRRPSANDSLPAFGCRLQLYQFKGGEKTEEDQNGCKKEVRVCARRRARVSVAFCVSTVGYRPHLQSLQSARAGCPLTQEVDGRAGGSGCELWFRVTERTGRSDPGTSQLRLPLRPGFLLHSTCLHGSVSAAGGAHVARTANSLTLPPQDSTRRKHLTPSPSPASLRTP